MGQGHRVMAELTTRLEPAAVMVELVVGRVQLDVGSGTGGRAALGHRAAVIGDEVAVADHVVEEVGRGLAAVMPVGDARPLSRSAWVNTEPTEGRRRSTAGCRWRGGGDPVLALFGAVVGVAATRWATLLAAGWGVPAPVMPLVLA